MTVSTIDVKAEWTERLASVRADLTELLNNGDRLRAARRDAIALIRAADDAAFVSCSNDENRAFVESLLGFEELVRDVQFMLNVW